MKVNDRFHETKAWLVTLTVHTLLILLLAALNLGIPSQDPSESTAGGMALALGVPEGLPENESSVSSSKESESQTEESQTPPVATQDVEEAPTVPPTTKPISEPKPMDPRLERLLKKKKQSQNSTQNSENSPSKGHVTGSANAQGLSSGNGGFSASGDGLESRGFLQEPNPEKFSPIDAQVDIPIEVDRDGKIRVTGMPKGTKPLTPEHRRALVEATQQARFKPNSMGKELQKGVLRYDLVIQRKSK